NVQTCDCGGGPDVCGSCGNMIDALCGTSTGNMCPPTTTTTTVATTTTTRPTTTTTVATTTTTIATTTTTTATTTTTPPTTTSTTTTTVGTCARIVPSAAIANTYRLNGTTGEKRCTTTSASACNGGTRSGMSCTTDDTNATTGCPGATCPGCCVATRFKTCNTDADCGNTAGGCLQLPWVTAHGQGMPFPTGVQTTVTVAPGSLPTCEHTA